MADHLQHLQEEAKKIEVEIRDAAIVLDTDRVLALGPQYKAVRKQLLAAFRQSISEAIHRAIGGVDYQALTGENITCITWAIDASGTEHLLINPEQAGHSAVGESRSRQNGAGTSVRTHQRIGQKLLREHGLPAQKGYFSKTGIPYQRPSEFPIVLFDPDGYLMVNDLSSLANNPYINVGKQVSIPNGIGSIPGYVTCGHVHE